MKRNDLKIKIGLLGPIYCGGFSGVIVAPL